MKLKSLFVFLMVCLMASAAFALSPAVKTTYWDGSTANWDDRDGTSNWVDESSLPASRPNGTSEVKLGGISDYGTPKFGPGGVCNLDSVERWISLGSNRMRVMGGATLNILPGSELSGPSWIRVGEGSGKGPGTVNQTGGLLKLLYCAAGGPSPSKDQSRLMMGDSQDTGGLTKGYYNISGGTLTHGLLPEDEVSVSEGRIVLGDRTGTGSLKVISDAPYINMGLLMIGGNYMSGAYRTATGTLEFELQGGAVSPVQINPTTASEAGSNGGYCVDIDGAGTGTANLVVKSLGATSGADILLVKSTDNNAVKGSFDTVTGDNGLALSGAEGTWIWVGGKIYMLTYMYDSISGTRGMVRSATYNDIALVPEPATLALLGLGLLVIRRKK